MAKRRRKTQEKQTIYQWAYAHRSGLLKLFWGLVIGISALFGYLQGYPLVQAGQVGYGLLIGLLYGGGAFLAILGAFYLNRKLKGY
ncbi:MAG: hypothetical protein Kow0031_03400 [Anaerolineae bacterium]